LRPVSYIIDLPALDNYYQPDKKNNDDIASVALQELKQQSFRRAATHRETGFIAQEVEQPPIKQVSILAELISQQMIKRFMVYVIAILWCHW